MTRIYIGNLDYSVSESGLKELVVERADLDPQRVRVKILRHMGSLQSRGKAFVDVNNDDADDVLALDGELFMDRVLKVQLANTEAVTR